MERMNEQHFWLRLSTIKLSRLRYEFNINWFKISFKFEEKNGENFRRCIYHTLNRKPTRTHILVIKCKRVYRNSSNLIVFLLWHFFRLICCTAKLLHTISWRNVCSICKWFVAPKYQTKSYFDCQYISTFLLNGSIINITQSVWQFFIYRCASFPNILAIWFVSACMACYTHPSKANMKKEQKRFMVHKWQFFAIYCKCKELKHALHSIRWIQFQLWAPSSCLSTP